MFAQTTSVLFALSILGFTSTSAAPSSASAGLEARASYDGTATYYYQGGNPGSCGDYHSGKSSRVESLSGSLRSIDQSQRPKTERARADLIDNDWIVAVNSAQQSGSCGKKVKITNTKNGKTATALAADTCKLYHTVKVYEDGR